MKIAVYFNSMLPAGGIERVISKHIWFLSANHEITLFTKDEGISFYPLPDFVNRESLNVEMSLDMNSRIQRIYKIASGFMKTTLTLRKKFKHFSPDIVYVASPLSLLEVFVSQGSCRKILVTEHSSFSAYNSIYQFISKFLYKRVGLLTVPTTADSDFYSSHGIKNSYLPNPLSFFPDFPASLDNKIVLNVGRFADDKRHELLINIWSKTKGKDCGWKLKIIGKGENSEKINALITKLKLENSITILAPTKDIESQFVSSSIFVLTSRNEGFGLVLAEAMASGVPCVAFNCPSGPKDIITDSQNGYLVEEGNQSQFVRHLDNLMENEALRKMLGGQARIDIQKFDELIISERLNILINACFTAK
jgi:glycosyltransferase involved in cell wall biosynthesis